MSLLEGKYALVTGSASGIGLATATRLTKEGAKVAIVDLNDKAGKGVASDLEGYFVKCDVTESSQVVAAFEEAEKTFGRLDIAHLNAGVGTAERDVTKVTDEQYLRVRSVNIDGVFFGVREAVKAMERAGGGAIVATASISGLNAYPPDPVYSATKHAVVGLCRGLAAQLKPKNITINAICPGIVETPMIGKGGAEALRQSGFPLIRPEEIAEAVFRAVTDGDTGRAWVIQPGRDPLKYEFRGIPGPRTPGAEGKLPPGLALSEERS